MGSSKQTTETTIPGASAQEADLQALLAGIAKSAAGDMGSMADLAAGRISPSESDRQFIETTQNAAAEIARKNAERNYASQRRMVEDQAINRGMDSSTIEAVGQGLIGAENVNTLNNITLQQQGQMAEMMTSLPFQRANVQLSANQALLQKLVGAANPVLQGALQERLAQQKTTQTTKANPWQMALGAAQAAGSIAAGGD